MRLPQKFWLRVAIGVLLGYCTFVAALYTVQRHMQYLPDTTNPSPSATIVPEMQEVQIKTADGLTNENWVYLPQNASRVVVFFHGNASNVGGRGQKARAIIDGGNGLMLVGYRGYGGNPGSPSQDGFFADARAAVEYLKNARHIPMSNMVFYGESLGSGVAVQMAHEYPKIAGLVLDVPFDSALSVAQERYPFVLGMSHLLADPYRSDLLIGDLKMPKLFLGAGQDTVVPIGHAKHLFTLAPEPKKFVEFKKSGHSNTYDFGAGKVVVDFLNKLSRAPQKAEQGIATPDEAIVPNNLALPPESGMTREDITVLSAGVERAHLNVELAVTNQQMEYGLMNRTSLPEDQGMLFIFPGNVIARFWMKNTLIPLDMVFIDQDGRIITMYENAQPEDQTTISSQFQVRSVLEINAGLIKKYNLQIGDLVLSPTLDKVVAASNGLNE